MSIFRRRSAEGERTVPAPADAGVFAPPPPGPALHPATPDGPPVYADPAVAAREADVPAEGVDDARVDPPVERGVEDPVPQVAPVSRPGRNIPMATVMGVLIMGITLVAAWFSPAIFGLFLYAACIAAVMEWRRALQRHDRRIAVVPIVLAAAGMGVATWYGGPEGLVVAAMVSLAGTVAWRVVDERIENTLADALASMLTLLWIPFLASFLMLLAVAGDGWYRVLIVVLAVVGNDTGGLFSGMAFGKHPMAPRVSPKKTWEGFVGGLLLGTAAATAAAYFLYDGRWWIGAIVGAAACIAAVLGDLAESAIKRDIQVKDMSSVIPGHGGIMDRIDSMLLAAPVAYVAFALLLGTS